LKRATQHTEELRGATSRFEAKLKPLIDKERQFNKAVRQVNDAMRLGVATQKQAIAEVERLGKAYGRTKQQIDRTTASMTGIRKNTNRMNATIQNAGYQFGDFFVQVQSGQNVLVAFSQQGAQLAGLLPGLAGAVTGVALVIGSMLVRALADGSTFFKSFVDLIEESRKALEEFRGAASFSASTLKDGLGKEVEYFSDVVLKRKLKGAVEESQSVLDKLLKASDPDRMTLFGKKLETSLLVSRRVLGPINQELVEANDFIQNLSSVDPTNAESLKAAIAGVAEILEKYTEDLGLSEASQEALVEYGKELELTLRDVVSAQEENTSEVEKQKDFLIEIVRLEEARDRINQSLEQKFSNSTRRLELLKSGMSAGQAGKAISMENMIADAVAAERALQSQLMNPLELQKYMGDFENALKVRLKGFNDEQVAAEELLKARRKIVSTAKETLPASIYGQAIGPEMPKAGSRAGFDITSAAEENRKQIERQIELAGLLSDSFIGAFRDIASGTETASDAFKKMSIAIVEHILEILIWKPLIESLTNALSPTAVGGSVVGGLLGNLFPAANGAAINNGNVVPFAYGGVVNSPTLFGMSGGRTGLMGEAGPEAILPLKRGAGGKLGVEGGGNVTVHQSFNFAANGDESVKKIIAEAAPGIAKMTEAQIVNSRQRGGQMRRVFS
jgi:hypothetical protein